MMRVATTLLSPEEMGKVSLVLTTIAFFAMFLINPVGMFINRRLHAWQASGIAQYYLVRYVSYLLLVAFIAAISLPFLYMSGVADFGVSIGWLIVLVCGSLFFNTINQTAIPSLNMLGDSGRFVLLSIATIAASFASATILVQWLGPLAQHWLFGLLLGQTLLAVIGTRVFISRLQQPGAFSTPKVIHKRHLRVLINFAWPVAIAVGLGWVQGQGYRYLMEGQLGLVQLGLFVAGYGISAGIIAGFESVITTYFQPRLYRNISAEDSVSWARSWREYAVVIAPSLLLTAAFIATLAPELTRIFLGNKFQSAANYVIWGAFAETVRMLTGTYSLVAHVHMRTRWLMLPNLIGAVLSMGLCVTLIPIFGAAGAGIALTLSGLAAVIAMRIMLGERASGGIPKNALRMAIVLAGGLWVITKGIRYALNFAEFWNAAVIIILIGLGYVWMQYLLLREHLEDSRRA